MLARIKDMLITAGVFTVITKVVLMCAGLFSLSGVNYLMIGFSVVYLFWFGTKMIDKWEDEQEASKYGGSKEDILIGYFEDWCKVHIKDMIKNGFKKNYDKGEQ